MGGGETKISGPPPRWGDTFFSVRGGHLLFCPIAPPITPPDFFCQGGHLPPQTLRIWGGNDLVPPHYGGEIPPLLGGTLRCPARRSSWVREPWITDEELGRRLAAYLINLSVSRVSTSVVLRALLPPVPSRVPRRGSLGSRALVHSGVLVID